MPPHSRRSGCWRGWATLPILLATRSVRRWRPRNCPRAPVCGAPKRNPMSDIEVHIDLEGRLRRIGLARCNQVRGTETIVCEYADEWLRDPDRFSIEPALALTRGLFPPPSSLSIFGSIGDSAPDTWGRRLMQRAERRTSERERRR